jgi:hypothetical protein
LASFVSHVGHFGKTGFALGEFAGGWKVPSTTCNLGKGPRAPMISPPGISKL